MIDAHMRFETVDGAAIGGHCHHTGVVHEHIETSVCWFYDLYYSLVVSSFLLYMHYRLARIGAKTLAPIACQPNPVFPLVREPQHQRISSSYQHGAHRSTVWPPRHVPDLDTQAPHAPHVRPIRRRYTDRCRYWHQSQCKRVRPDGANDP